MAEEEEEDVGCSTTSTTSKEEGDDPYKGWLQLGIAGNSTKQTSSTSRSSELNLFPTERPPLMPMVMTSSSVFPDIQPPTITWGLRGPPPMTITGYSFTSGGEFTVVSPPARRRTGVWFELRALEIQ